MAAFALRPQPVTEIVRAAEEPPDALSDEPTSEVVVAAPDIHGPAPRAPDGELVRLHVVSYLQDERDVVAAVLRPDPDTSVPVERGCSPGYVRRSSFVAPSGLMGVPEPIPTAVEIEGDFDPAALSGALGLDVRGPGVFGASQAVDVEPYDRVTVQALPLEERWVFEVSDGGRRRTGVATRAIGLCFAVFAQA